MDFKVDPAFISYAKATERSKLSTDGLNAHIKSTNKSFTQMSIKAKIAGIAVGLFNSIVSAGISLLTTFIIGKVIDFFDDLSESQEELAEAATNAQAKIEELNSTLKTHQSLVKNVAERYAELAQGVNDFNGENINLSKEEYEEFLNLVKDLKSGGKDTDDLREAFK